jgi:hypothetical protein
MSDRLERAASGRARCRGCGAAIAKDTLRFGEELPRSSSAAEDATSVFWFHLRCAAHRRPEKLAQLLRARDAADPPPEPVPDRDALLADAELALAHPRLARIAGAERASSGRARCRHCHEPIAQGQWRIRLGAFAETGFPEPLGFLHTGCIGAYFGLTDIAARVQQASPGLSDEDRAALDTVLAVAPAG